jgi:hypothetical protein
MRIIGVSMHRNTDVQPNPSGTYLEVIPTGFGSVTITMCGSVPELLPMFNAASSMMNESVTVNVVPTGT